MHECLLCKRNMKKSNTVFGSGCINNIFKFLDISKPYKLKNKETFLYKNIMKKTHIYGVNKNQKTWLTDRYLTYQYLDKLPYGDFASLKIELDIDIRDINKIGKFEELLTSEKISLKEVRDLYNKETKFETNLERIKNNEYKDNEELDFIFSSISFVFNKYANKNIYTRGAFIAMQYAFWQTVIEVGGKYAGFDISADFLQHSLREESENLLITEGKVIEEIKNDNQFKEKIEELIKKYGEGKKKFTAKGQESSIHFNNSDLYFSIHSADAVIEGKKNKDKWDLSIKLHDIYDFTDFKDFGKYYNDTNSMAKSLFSSTLYNLAYFSVELGVIKPYEIDIEFNINDYEEKD